MHNLKHREKLLSDLTDILNGFLRPRTLGPKKPPDIRFLSVHFMKGNDILVTMEFSDALNSVINDIYWNEEGNWSETDRLIPTPY